MDNLPLHIQIIILIILILCSAFFSGSETSMMALNKHKLKHLATKGDKAAKRALLVLSRPDRLLGTILLGNNFINILAASLATIIGLKLFGSSGVFIMSAVLTVLILIFGEVAPKTFAALHPEKFAFPASAVLKLFLFFLYPIVVAVNYLAAIVLRPFGLKDFSITEEAVGKEELKSILRSDNNQIDDDNQDMILGLLYLYDINVEDIMVPKHELLGLDIDDEWADCRKQILSSEFSRLLVYKDNIDDLIGILHLNDILKIYHDDKELNLENMLSLIEKPYFIPEGTSLRKQLQMFQEKKIQTGIVVDEYGEVVGLLTLEDILEYIIGDLDLQEMAEDVTNKEEIIQKSSNSYQIDGTTSINFINKELDWNLPSMGQKTISGLILEKLGEFPKVGVVINIKNYKLSVLSFAENRIQEVLVEISDDEDN